MLCGQSDQVRRLADLPTEDQLQPQLSERFIEQEVEVLSRPSRQRELVAGPEAALAESAGRIGALVLQRVETVNS